MRYMATVYVSDVMDQVAATVEIQGWSAQYGPPETIYEKTHIWPGLGIDDASMWLRVALRAIAGEMVTAPEEGTSGAAPMGGPHTISETGDNRI